MKNGDTNTTHATQNSIQELRRLIEGLESLHEYRLPQRAYHIIRLAIRDLILPPGKTILEREMSEVLEMSRTPVREALVRLETEGVVRLIPRRGFIVEPIVQEDLKEIYQIVENLDGLAIEIATKKAEDEKINQLEAIIEQQEAALENKNLKEWAVLDDRFHSMIIELAGNKRLSSIIEIHSDQTYRARLFTINNRPLPLRSIKEHKAITACMRAKDENAARIMMQSHRKRAQQEILAGIEKINNKQEQD
ncbi:GntR family transcriptional regulator [Paenibacillus sp. 7884-2]|nr:GntR family transcriptional regulator [Paenibacillus sp. 7884-2]